MQKTVAARRSPGRVAFRVGAVYLVLSAAWIVASDLALNSWVHDPERAQRISVYKGWTFVAVTALLLFWGVRRLLFGAQKSEREVARLNRVYATLGQINEAAARATSREELFAKVCAVATEQAGFELAWIGWRDPATERMVPVGRAGNAARYLDRVEIYADDRPAGLGPMGMTMREGRPVIFDDLPADPVGRPWQSLFLEFGLHSVATFPIQLGGELVGAFAVYSRYAKAFGDKEVVLLSQATQNISFALGGLEREAGRVRAEKALRESGERLELITGTIREVFWMAAPDGTKLLYISPAFEDVWGLSREALMDNPMLWIEVVVPEDAARVVQAYQALGRGTPYDLDYRIRRPDGTIRWINDRGYPRRDADGKVVLTSGVATDITQRKVATLLLEESEDRFRTLMESVPAGLCELTGGRFHWVNDHAARLLGAAAAELIGTSIEERLSEPSRLALAGRLRAVDERGEPLMPEEQRLLRLDGRPLEAEVSAVPVQRRGERSVLVFLRDISDRRVLEEQLRQAQKMEAIGTLAGGVAHDFNNLLTVIQSSASLQLEPDSGGVSQRELVREVLDAAERAAGLTRQLLLFSRKQELQPVSLDLNDVVGNLAKMLRRILGEDVALQTESAALPQIQADVGMIEQVLLNLVANARDAMPSGGHLTIATSTAPADEAVLRADPEAVPGPCVILTVSDTGDGIPPEVLPHIFEPFFTTKDVGKGTGLGLATVYGIVKQHHGRIAVESELGKGTIFRIWFRASAEAAAQPLAASPLSSQLKRGNETILVVEDDDSVRRGVVSILGRCGYQVLEASSGTRALELWRSNKSVVQLLLTDVVMPEKVSGIALAAQLTGERPDLKVIYTSGYSTQRRGDGPLLVEGDNFLRKPYAAGQLAEIVRRRLTS